LALDLEQLAEAERAAEREAHKKWLAELDLEKQAQNLAHQIRLQAEKYATPQELY
jgi:membrane protein required for beta-lactamase induction